MVREGVWAEGAFCCVTACPPDRPGESDHSSVKSAFTAVSLGAEGDRLARSKQPWQDGCQRGTEQLEKHVRAAWPVLRVL